MATTAASRRRFVPGMGVDWLLPLYDPLTWLLRLDRARRELLLQADLRPGHRVLDIGCGTGSLAVLTKRLVGGVEVVGIDPDEKALARAVRKARHAGVSVQFALGFSDVLDYPAASFDRVFSSFMFHHLARDEKERTLRAICRVLKDGGSLHLLDFGGPESVGHGSRVRGLHAHDRLTDNDERTILGFLTDAGLTNAAKTADRTVLRLLRIVYYRAERSLT
jgi:ubiquinone/menaquinone biosynthesis C-methylase UbiE